MNSITWDSVWFAVVALGALVVLRQAVQWLRVMRQPDVRTRRDDSLMVDMWTAERRRHLVDLQRPAAKGFDAHKHTVLPMATRKKAQG